MKYIFVSFCNQPPPPIIINQKGNYAIIQPLELSKIIHLPDFSDEVLIRVGQLSESHYYCYIKLNCMNL